MERARNEANTLQQQQQRQQQDSTTSRESESPNDSDDGLSKLSRGIEDYDAEEDFYARRSRARRMLRKRNLFKGRWTA